MMTENEAAENVACLVRKDIIDELKRENIELKAEIKRKDNKIAELHGMIEGIKIGLNLMQGWDDEEEK